MTVRLKLNHDSTQALAEVTARLQQVRAELPVEAEPPVIEVQRADRPYATFYLSFNSTERGVPAITDYLLRTVQPQLATIEGVQRVTNNEGGRQIAMRVWIDPDRLAALNLSPGDVQAALQRNNYLAAVGQTKGNQVQINLMANTDLRSVDEFANLIVADRGGAIVRLSDVARVELGAEEADLVAKYNRAEGVYLGVWPLVGANEIEVARRLRDEMERIRPTLPKDIEMRLVWDGTMFMRDALKEITKTLSETIAIVGLVVFLFMGSIRTALVPLVAIPISLVGAALVMYTFGFSLNLLTILAIVLSVGLVVDDAIVVENVERHVRMGKSRIQAALIGARELVGPIIAMTITLAAVYTPIGLQGGLTGSLFLEFAITLAAAVVVSGVVAITLSPVMSSRFVHPRGKEGRLTALVNRGFEHLRRVYAWLLDGALQMRGAIVVAALLVTAAAWPLYTFSRTELAPAEDQSHISLFFEASPDSTLAATNRDHLEVVEVLTSFPETDFTWSLTSAWGGFGGLVAKDWKKRARSTEEMYGEVFGAISQISGLRVFPRLDPPLPTPGHYDVELVLQSDAPVERMLDTTAAVLRAGWKSGKFLYVDTDLKIDLPEARVVLDRERIADLGLDLAGVGRELGTLLGGDYVNRFSFFDRSYKVIPQIGDEDRATLGPLLDLKIKTPDGQLVPVSTFTDIETTTSPRTLNRFQQRNAVRIFGGVQPGVTKEEGLRVLENAAAAASGPVVGVDYTGESRQIRREGSALTVTLGFAVVLIYLVLAAQFQSFRDPLIVLLGSVPLAISGALIFSFLDLTTINIYSQVGLITLVGLISKNGILIVQFANQLQARGLAKMAALREAALTRLRPVLMTSVATVFGHLPLVLVTGPGAEARNSIGTVLVTGMTVGTLFTLFVVPVFYSLIAARHQPAELHEDTERETRPPAPALPALSTA